VLPPAICTWQQQIGYVVGEDGAGFVIYVLASVWIGPVDGAEVFIPM